jgi:hypothetical protein
MTMRSVCAFTIAACLLVIVPVADAAAQELNDPYEILNRFFQTSGGLERLLAEETSYSEGSLSLGSMEGTVKVWSKKPGQSRAEISLGPLNIIQGDNGEHTWVLDQNGKLQVITNPDEATLKRRQVQRLIEQYAFAERESGVFTVGFEGVEPVEGKDCYVVRIANNINTDSYTSYVNTQTFLQEKAVFLEGDQSRDSFYGDYRKVDGLLVPFLTREVMHRTGQAHEVKLTQYLSNPVVDAGRFEPPEEAAKDYRFVAGDRAENIPFEFIGNHIFIPVIVGGKERLYVLDTGAGMTVLNTSFAEELGLPLEGGMKGQGAGGTVEASFTTSPPFRMKGIEFQEQTVAVIEMSELMRRIGLDVDGILGFGFLSRFVTKVDFANELLSFYEPEGFEYSGNGHMLGIHLEESVFRVEATLDGSHCGTWLFDLGAGTTHLDGRYALRESYTTRTGLLGIGHGACNEYQLKHVRCDSLQFAGFTVYEPLVSFSYGGTETDFTSDQIGVLGNSLFRNFVIYCDYAGERLFVEKGDKFNLAWPRDNSGLQLAWSENREVKVIFVAPDTPAEKAGFLKGDLIRSINGIDVGLFDGLIAIRVLLKAEPGIKYEFGIDRAGKDKKLELRLARLL